MALFRRKVESEVSPGSADHRSKRGGVRRTTAEINIDLSALEKRAGPAPAAAESPVAPAAPAAPAGPRTSARAAATGAVPSVDPTTAHNATKRMPAPIAPGPGGSRRSTRSAGRGTPIGEHLIQAAAINTEQLTKALRTQEKQGGLVGQILVKMGACRPEDIAAALGKQFRPTALDLSRVVPRINAMLLFSVDRCREHKLIPFERLDQLLCVAMVNILNRKALTQLESLTKLKVKAFTGNWQDIQACIDKYYTPQVNEAVTKVEAERLNDAGKALALADRLDAELSGARAAPAAAPAAAQAAAPGTAAPAAPAAGAKPAAPSPEELAKPFIAEAQALRSQGKLGEAIKRLEIGLSNVPESKTLQKGMAQLKKEFEDKRAAEAALHTKVAELLAKGRTERDGGDAELALATFQEAAKLDPHNNVVARELSNTQKEFSRIKAERAAQRKVDEEARAAEGKRQAETEAKKQSQIAELLALAKAARGDGRLLEAESRLKDVLGLSPAHAVARSLLAEVQAELGSAEKRRNDTVQGALHAAERLVDAGKFAEAKAKIQEAVKAVGEDPGLLAALHDVDAAVRQKDKQEEAGRRRQAEEQQQIEAEAKDLVEQAARAFAAGDLESAEQKLEDALALAPDSVVALGKLGEVRDAMRARLEEEDTRRRADEERRKRESVIRARLREAAEDREAGRLELALKKLQGIDQTDPGRDDVRGALASVEADIERTRSTEAERLKHEEEERRHIEEELRRRATVVAEASADRKRVEAAVGGEQRLEAGSVSEGSLVALQLTPEAELNNVADAVARRTGGGAASTTEALRRLPVAQTYAKSLESLRKLAEAAKAAEAALDQVEMVDTGDDEEVLELELEPALDAQPPMPDLEAQLEAAPEAILEATPLEDEAVAGTVEAEMTEVPAERLAATPMSDAEYEGLKADLAPDPAQDWWDAFASAGPVPAVPLEE